MHMLLIVVHHTLCAHFSTLAIYILCYISLQIHTASTQKQLRELFQAEGYSTLVNETGFRKPLLLLTLGDKSELVHTLWQYYTFF